ncbi:hypothetical protein MLD38_016958 [Melastoma candidum]|uniref:Uncharacterized protein n=1 Tax=Melastoma candidum TaxID=119954 RepID=A0ACB9QP95_9MYRT|nr:hypothetical protein MLD38_016958 [Melastoma candidum]
MKFFLACFGFPVKRKKKRKSFVSPDDDGSYRPLTSFLEEDDGCIGVVGDPRLSRSLSSSVRGVRSGLTRKKVRFDLNVQAYEPLPPGDSFFCRSDGEEIIEETEPMVSSMGRLAFPSNYRYQNCRDSSDEEDGSLYEDDDGLVFEQDDDEYFGDDEAWKRDRHQLKGRSHRCGSIVQSDSVCTSFEEKNSFPRSVEDNKSIPVLHPAASTRLKENACFRDGYARTVLNPVENTVQRKMIKAEPKLPDQKQNKENRESKRELHPVPSKSRNTSKRPVTSCETKSRTQHVPVNASLSAWLVPVEP